MRITTVPATEEPSGVPTKPDLEVMQQLFPNVKQFDFPTPEDVEDTYHHIVRNYPLLDPRLALFATGIKLRGGGYGEKALLSYYYTYKYAIIPLLELQSIGGENTLQIEEYFIQHPVYKKKEVPFYFSADMSLQKYVSESFRLLNMWINNPNFPAYSVIVEPLNALYMKVKRDYITAKKEDASSPLMHRVPQRPTTSRGRISSELSIKKLNIGYKFMTMSDPYTGEKGEFLKLVTWFFTESRTVINAFRDFFEVKDGNQDAAYKEMTRSMLYQQALTMSPDDYANSCYLYAIGSSYAEEEVTDPDLTIVAGGTYRQKQ